MHNDARTPSAQEFTGNPAATRPVRWRLHVLVCPDRRWVDRVLDLDADGVVLGRAPTGVRAQRIDDPIMSREHLFLRPTERNDALELRDLGSHNGTYRSGVRTATAILGHDAVLRFGGSLAMVQADLGEAEAFFNQTAQVPGHSEPARRLRQQLEAAARGRQATLISGPTGSGKEFAALEYHLRSGRRGPLVHLHAPTITAEGIMGELLGRPDHPGRLHEAEGGTLVLDEVGELALDAQPKLLRVIEDPTIRLLGQPGSVRADVRIVATTNADLQDKVRAGTFRQDLAARLIHTSVAVPALRQRRADLVALADVLVPIGDRAGLSSWSAALTAELWETLVAHDWPDNLRELAALLRALEQHLTRAPLDRSFLPQHALRDRPGPGPTRKALTDAKAVAPDEVTLHRLLARYQGSIEDIARHFGRHRKQVYRWLERAAISQDAVDRYRRGG